MISLKSTFQLNVLSAVSCVLVQDYRLQMSIELRKENGFTLKTRSIIYPAETIADDLALLANTQTLAKRNGSTDADNNLFDIVAGVLLVD